MHLILACAMVAQGFSMLSAPNKDARADLNFTQAVEDSVMAFRPEATPPEPYLSLLGAMGHAEWRKREEASRAMKARLEFDRGGIMWLFWGRRYRDMEVRLRSNAILRRTCLCPTCGGNGRSKTDSDWPCWDCDGFGTAWPWTMWD